MASLSVSDLHSAVSYDFNVPTGVSKNLWSSLQSMRGRSATVVKVTNQEPGRTLKVNLSWIF